MIKIELCYDPYHMKTSLDINGKSIKEDGEGYEKIQQYLKKAIPLQSWIDPIPFQEWRGLLMEAIGNSNETEVECHFRGRELDFIDLKESFDRQSKRKSNERYDISVKYPTLDFIYTDEKILERAEKAYKQICSEDFKQVLDDKIFELGEDSQLVKEYNALERKYQAAREAEFRIVFSGMYTCGKSTLINAILGKDILPTRDGTCTSKVFKISHDPNVEYARMSCIDAGGKVVVKEQEYTAETLHEAFRVIFSTSSHRTQEQCKKDVSSDDIRNDGCCDSCACCDRNSASEIKSEAKKTVTEGWFARNEALARSPRNTSQGGIEIWKK